MIPIRVKSRSSGESLGEVALPSFCVDHMRMSSPEMNLTTMMKHIENRCGGLKVQRVYVADQLRTGITADEVANGLELLVE